MRTRMLGNEGLGVPEPSQLALAWVLGRGGDVVPIPGTKRRRYLEQNVSAAEVELTSAEIDEIESITPKGAIAGERYADMTSVGLLMCLDPTPLRVEDQPESHGS